MACLRNNSSSSTFRFLGQLKQPDSDPNVPLELDESDVVWSSSSFSSDSTNSFSHSPPSLPSSPPRHLRRSRNHLKSSKSGLSAALTDNHDPLVRHKSTLNPSASAASAATIIHPVTDNSASSSPKGGWKYHQSAPVNVPVWPKRTGELRSLERFDEVEDDLEEEEMVPPHLIVARSHVTFSVFEGVGRTLKGRDLRRVRNAVFQKTGFID